VLIGTIELNPNRSAPTVRISLPCSSKPKKRGKKGREERRERSAQRVRRRKNKLPFCLSSCFYRRDIRTSFPMEAVLEEAGRDMVGRGRRQRVGEKDVVGS